MDAAVKRCFSKVERGNPNKQSRREEAKAARVGDAFPSPRAIESTRDSKHSRSLAIVEYVEFGW